MARSAQTVRDVTTPMTFIILTRTGSPRKRNRETEPVLPKEEGKENPRAEKEASRASEKDKMPLRIEIRDGTMMIYGMQKRSGTADIVNKTRNGSSSGTNRAGKSRAGPAMMRMIGRRIFLSRIRLHQ